jgi:hypothetical protein
MPDDYPQTAGTCRARRLHEFTFFQSHYFRPHKPGRPHPTGQTDDDHYVENGRIKKSHRRQDKEESRKTEHDVHAAHYERVHASAVKTGQGTKNNAQKS